MSAQISSNSSRQEPDGVSCVGKRIARRIVKSTSGGSRVLALKKEPGPGRNAILSVMCAFAPSHNNKLKDPLGASAATSSIMNLGKVSPNVLMQGTCSILIS